MKKLSLPNVEKQRDLLLAKHLINSYVAARSGRNLQGDYAEWLVAHFLEIELSDNPVEKAVDARDADGHTYQIKSRMVKPLTSPTSFDITDINAAFDYLIGVFFDTSFQVLGIIQSPYAVVKELGSQSSTTFRLRWNKKTQLDQRIERLFWSQ